MELNRRKFIATTGAIGLAGLAPGLARAQTEFLVLRGGANTGSWFTGSAVISKNVTERIPNFNMTATLGGGVRNPTDVQIGEAQYAFGNARSAFEALEGLEPYTEPHDKLRAMVSFFPTPLQIVARKDSGINSFRDLIGKRVSPGQRGFSTAYVWEQLVQRTGHTMDDVETFYINYADANQAFQDRQLDAIMAIAGLPSAQYMELAQLVGIKTIPVDDDLIEAWVADNPGYARITIPAGLYEGWDEPADTIQSPTILMTSTDRSEDEVYEITRIIWESRDELEESNPGYRAFQLATATEGTGLPLHEGAARYWREQGLDV
jgi:TRAP transporter TAXI family solute receptor